MSRDGRTRTPLDRTCRRPGQSISLMGVDRMTGSPEIAVRLDTIGSSADARHHAEGASRRAQLPDALGRFGTFGGRFVPETLMDALNQTGRGVRRGEADPAFQAKLDGYLADYVGRPSPLFLAERLTQHSAGRGDLPQARRPEPHRRSQDQQRARPGACSPSGWARPG